jgi:FSR family fosmidomycin resistance protein-like MFS transporter
MADSSSAPNLRIIFIIALVHFTGDFYNSFISPLFPVFADKLDLTLAQIGLVAGISRFLSFIVQPSVGYLADRYANRSFVIAGLLLAVVFIPLSGLAPSFGILILCVGLGSVGSSMFHPPVAGMVPLYSGNKQGLMMSLFNTAGTTAFAVGPLFITAFVAGFGLEAMAWTMVFGLAVTGYLFFHVPVPQTEGFRHLGFFGSLKETLGPAFKPILLIWSVMVLRAVVGQSFLTFMPVLFVRQGYSLTAAGAMYALFTVAGTITGIACGHLSDRIGYKPIFIVTHTLMTPALIALLFLPGAWAYAGAALAGGFVLATLPLGVVMAQTLAPRGRSMVSSLMMGLAYGLGGILAPLVGKFGDLYDIHDVLLWVAFLPLVSLVPICFFPLVGADRRNALKKRQ